MKPSRHRSLRSRSLVLVASGAVVVATHLCSGVANSFVGSFQRASLCDTPSISPVGMLASQAVAPVTQVDGGATPTSRPGITVDSYAALAGVPLVRASDGKKVDLPSLWGNGFFGLGGDKVVVAFLRHFG
eukprot:TRINITY_DN9243_c0_g1_i1.p1 TRINITY_DN9243_c0_g1~~TRINITY_DN9243_c0_g1_i1.p1  ORF type:complete len:130 (-),score=16.47 TRINITY_DN9243_c0_g1_i1:696-1085(-)